MFLFSMFLFATATLAPLAFLIAGALWGSWWIAGGIFVITVFTWAADHLMRHAAAVTGRDDEFPSGDGLAVVLAVLLLAGLGLAVRAFGAVLVVGLAFALAGWGGVLALLGIAGYAQVQILLSDYIQHYGLRRIVLADGRLEPVGPRHSWNAPQAWSSAMMLNAPRHADHHAHPGRPYPGLRLEGDMPMLPRAVPVMAVAALIPPPVAADDGPARDAVDGVKVGCPVRGAFGICRVWARVCRPRPAARR